MFYLNFLNKITFKNIAKYSLMSFIFGIFPLIALLLFYNPAVSILGLLFSYIGWIGTVLVINALFFVKNKFFIVADLISNKINSMQDEKTSKYTNIGVKVVALLISVGILYSTFLIGSLFLDIISLISVLNPIMIIVLNIYYVIMALAFEGNN